MRDLVEIAPVNFRFPTFFIDIEGGDGSTSGELIRPSGGKF